MALLAGLPVGVARAGQAPPQPYPGIVVGVVDGDTVRVLDSDHRQHKVRLQGIDAPEKTQAFGRRSREMLAARVLRREVRVETHKLDRYGREVGRLLLDGADVDLEQVQQGMAWHYKAYEREQPPEDRQAYAEAERLARDARLGLWSDPRPVPPWEYRRRQAR